MRILIYIAFVLPLLCGCVNENDGECVIPNGLKLDFAFTNNRLGQNTITEDVRDVRVYVFDQKSGIMRYVLDLAPEDIARGWITADIPSGTYTMVAWANNSDNMMDDGFEASAAADINGDGKDEYTTITQGITTLSEFRMMLAYDELPVDTKGDITPKVEDFGSLYFASLNDVNIDRSKNQEFNFDFVLNTSTLNVRVNGLQYLSPATRATDAPISVFVIGRNGMMECGNQTDSTALRMRYNPYNQTVGTDTLTNNIKSMRLDLADKVEDDVLLYVQQPNADADIIDPIDLVDLILATCDGEGNTIYNNQRDLDIETEFTLDITIATDLTVSVSVNGFTPVVLTPQESDAEKTPNKTE